MCFIVLVRNKMRTHSAHCVPTQITGKRSNFVLLFGVKFAFENLTVLFYFRYKQVQNNSKIR